MGWVPKYTACVVFMLLTDNPRLRLGFAEEGSSTRTPAKYCDLAARRRYAA
jgi:hypothetical protein